MCALTEFHCGFTPKYSSYGRREFPLYNLLVARLLKMRERVHIELRIFQQPLISVRHTETVLPLTSQLYTNVIYRCLTQPPMIAS